MKKRGFWREKIESAWKRKTVIWMMGVRRAGKTSLCKSLESVEYFDFELPSARRMARDPEAFLDGLKGKRVVLDEIHRLPNPSELLKIAADHHPDIKVLATGSSTLATTMKFKDSLAGRKAQLWLTPMVQSDLEDFGKTNLDHRFLAGGLPPFFLQSSPPEAEYQEWLDAYWAKDIEELFRLEKRDSFLRFFELLMAQSGGIFEATRFARSCEVSRTAIRNYLSALEETLVIHTVRPYTTHKPSEIVSAPKVYAFDTGFVCCHRGWTRLRPEDKGLLWEHFVLNEIHAHYQSQRVHYWRDKRGHEVDFILPRKGSAALAVECKSSPDDFNPAGLLAFHRQYPDAEAMVVCMRLARPFAEKYDGLSVRFTTLEGLINAMPVSD